MSPGDPPLAWRGAIAVGYTPPNRSPASRTEDRRDVTC
jgi:hypothetical protein